MRLSLPLLYAFLALVLVGCASSNAGAAGSPPTTFIENKGSDTMVNLALAWAEAYQSVEPQVSVSVTGGGSGTGITALANNTVDIANASRAIKDEEIAAMQKNGIDPLEFTVARDAIAVIVNLNNPVERLTLPQISDIYSGKITNWSEVGGEDRPIVRLSRETNSGTHVYFLEEVLRLGDSDNETFFSANTLLLPSSEGITAEVRDNPNAIGYDGLGYVVPEVKVLAVAAAGGDYFYPSVDTVNDLTYPIARDLYMYTAGAPSDVEQAYLDWIFSAPAQAIVAELGFVPVSGQP
ncbi:MAG TPA: PstS family phosphate ABC transporter substrate-binding protein [Anaerolineales bacterium]|nr:PstS family phosphate ABC transporter substrate-binding protein [Anaerolineales bacterium]